jgi:hypothetical protein
MTPHDHKIIARKIEKEKVESLIIMPDEVEEYFTMEVVATGRLVGEIKVGEKILTPKGCAELIENGLYSVSVDPDKILIIE